ncbi:MAG: methionyl-tRNA formyltransferase [Alphaproteobacteria bacterium]
MDGIHVFLNAGRGSAVVRRLAEAGHGIAAVHVPPERAQNAEIVAACDVAGLTPHPVPDVNDPVFVGTLADARLAVIGGYSTIFRKPLFDAPALGTINLHAGRLPQYRGGSPLNWQLINGEERAAISVIRVDDGIDTGDVLAEAEFAIGPADTIADLHERANVLFPQLVLDVVERFARGETGGRAQDPALGRYWHQRNDADGRIDWQRMTATQVHALVRAVTRPYPGAHTMAGDTRLRVFAVEVPALAIHGAPGRVVHLQRTGPYVVCADRAVLLRDYAAEDGTRPRLPTGTYLA